MCLKVEEATRKFHALVWPQLPMVLRVARILTGADVEAEDLTQETMLRAFKGIDGFADGTDVKAWLLTILRRARIDRSRSPATAHRMTSLDALEVDAAEPARPETTDQDVLWERPEELLNGFSDQQVIDALQELPEEIRLTLLLVDVEEMDQKDAAEILQVPVGTVKSRAHRGRAMLRSTLLPLAKELRLIRK
jgi:RNA polymerase sigma-70 factor (ECF subfamily)